MRTVFALLLMLVTVGRAQPAFAQVSVSVGINLPVFPELVVVPGYPVYYAPRVDADYFFYDGFYWVFNVSDGQWYSSSWYNGPWVYVEPLYVPQPILVIPFRYYRVRPAYWRGWAYDAPPRWGQHWGRDWESRRTGWKRWDRNHAVAPAPLPVYQREFPRGKYPAPSQQVSIQNERYKYQAHDVHVRQQRAAIVREQSSGGRKATAKAERVEHPGPVAPAREHPQRRETDQPPTAPRHEGPGGAPREKAAPQPQAPHRGRPQETVQPPAAPRQEGPAVEGGQRERGRRPEPQRVAPPPNAAPQQSRRGEQSPAPPSDQERQQPERSPEGHAGERPGQGRR